MGAEPKLVPLAPEDYERFGKPPEKGGLVTTVRAAPSFFGFENLPEIR